MKYILFVELFIVDKNKCVSVPTEYNPKSIRAKKRGTSDLDTVQDGRRRMFVGNSV